MQRKIVLGFLATGAFGNECLPGFKHKEDLQNRFCRRGQTDAVTCNSECCKKDVHTCGGIAGIVCEFDHYLATDDVTLKLAVTDKTKNTVCCKKKATCSEGTVPAGYKADADFAGKYCYGDASTCNNNNVCYQPDNTKCFGLVKQDVGDQLQAKWGEAGVNPGGVADPVKYYPGQTLKTNGDAFDTHSVYEQTDKWKNTAAGADPYVACFKTIATCASSYTCPKGLMKPAAAGGVKAWMQAGAQPKPTDKCDGPASKCPKICCVADLDKCGGWAVKGAIDYAANTNLATEMPCDADHYTPSVGTKSTNQGKVSLNSDVNYVEWAAKNTGETGTCTAKCKTNCCLKKPTCASFSCPAGKKKKPALSKTAVCSRLATCETECCQDDVNTCGGLIASGIQCKYGFYDASVDWDVNTPAAIKDRWNNKVANSTTKNDACCSPRVACQVEMNTVTPTPAVVVTTTPAAAPALKYSEHRTATEEASPKTSSLIWVGIGAVAGMGVLMAVQGLRSRTRQTEQEEEDDEETLLNTHTTLE